MSYVYDMTEEEKRIVRTMLAIDLARHGAICSITTDELLEGLGAGPEWRSCIAPLIAALAKRTVTEIRNGIPECFVIFKTLEPPKADYGTPFWRFSFTRKFRQFCVGRRL